MRICSSLLFTCAVLAALAPRPMLAAKFTTSVSQASGASWTGTIWDPGATAPSAGNTYELVPNAVPFGNSLANARLRNPAVAGIQTFPGDSLTLNTNTEIRAKQAGAILNFPGVGTAAGLILNGGVLNAGDDTVFTITGRVQIASTSFIVPADNGGGAVKPLRGFNVATQISGSGSLVIYQAGTNVAQEISSSSNSYTGDIVVKAGYLKGSGKDSLGKGNITIDPKAAVAADPSVVLAEGPAWLEVNYDLASPGKLTLKNGGQMILHQSCTFSSIQVENTTLTAGTHPYSELLAAFPNNFAPGGSGSLIIAGVKTNFTTKAVQASGQNWTAAIWEPGLVAPAAGNAYQTLSNGVAFGNNLANTRLRNPATAGVQTFPGDQLTLNANTEIRAKQAGAILNFPGVGANAGLVLNGGVLNAGDDTVFTITGKVQVASTSYIVPADNGGGAVKPLRGFNIAAQLSGSGMLVIYQAGTNVAQEISSSSNPYTGDILVKTGWLKGSGKDSLGSGNITIDPKAALVVDPSITLAEGPAWLELGYDIVTPAKLTLKNGGQMILHQSATFGSVTIENTTLSNGFHPYSELVASFPANFLPGGSGGIRVGAPPGKFTTKAVQGVGQNWGGTIWDPGAVAPVAGSVYELISNGVAFGNNQNNTRVRNPATAGVQTFPGDSLTLNPDTEIRAKQAGAILNFPGASGAPGLILNGGVLNAGDDAVFTITGRISVAALSYIAPADGGGGAVLPLRGFNIAGQLSGSAPLMIFQAGTNVAQEISGVSNSYSGTFILKAGWVKGSAQGSLGTASVVVDPKYPLSIPGVAPAEGPAIFEVNYDFRTPGTLTIANGGRVVLHQDITVDKASIDGIPLTRGAHFYDELVALYPSTFPRGGSGSLTVVNGPLRFTTMASQGAGQNWTAAIWDLGPVAPTAGNLYETVYNGIPFGNNLGNTRIRNPATAGVQTFPGDLLILNANTEIRAKQAGAILNFPGVGGSPGLILNGGVLNAGDDTVFTITGKVQVASTSYIVPADNGGGAIKPLRGFNIAAQLSGSGSLVIYQAGTNVAQEVSSSSNTYSGDIVLKAGWLKASGKGSLGTANVIVDPDFALNVDSSIVPDRGPALFEPGYNIATTGALTVRNGGKVVLHQDLAFRAASIQGTNLSAGRHLFSELIATFPNNFVAGGSGSITVQDPVAPATPANLVAVAGNAQVGLSFAASALANGYIVSRGTSATGPFTPVAAQGATNLTDASVVNGTLYFYVVAATNGFGSSTNTAAVSARPNAPVTGITARSSGANIVVTWTAFPGATNYTVKRATSAAGPFTTIATGVTGTSYIDTSAIGGTTQYYQVTANVTGGGESTTSGQASALTTPATPILTVTPFGTVQMVNVTAASLDPVQYVLERSTDGVNFTQISTFVNSTTYTATGLTPGVTYYYRSQGKNAVGRSPISNVAWGTVSLVSVNFANAVNGSPANNPAPIPLGYLQDVGQVYGDRGNGWNYGWSRDITADGRWRQNTNSADLRYDTLMHLQKATPSAVWEIQIPNGDYQVHVVSGDATAVDSVFQFKLENVTTTTNIPAAGKWWGEWTTNVTVADGKLTVDSGPLASNNKIDFIDITPAPKALGTRFLASALFNGTLTLSWTGSGRLQEAATVQGPWKDVAGNPQNFYFAGSAAAKNFYRVISP